MNPLRYAIIGCGLIGEKRLKALGPGQLAVACDTEIGRAEHLVGKAGTGKVVANFKEAVSSPEADAVIVATPNVLLSRVAKEAIQNGKHVLIEKPVAFHSREIQELATIAKRKRVCVRVGFNHRFHPALLKAREIFESGAMGPLMFVRGRYGHGGRLGYEKEWRADKKLSGGGELMDQGVHLIDLARWFLGDFKSVQGKAVTYFWKMKVDDNAFLKLENKKGNIAWLHVSWTEWKNMFSFEIYGRTGKIQIDGLGGSYGTERLHYYQMLPELGPPKTQSWEFPEEDGSWKREIAAFEEDIRLNREPNPGLKDAAAVLECVENIYRRKKT